MSDENPIRFFHPRADIFFNPVDSCPGAGASRLEGME
jgi:hypothetical protein